MSRHELSIDNYSFCLSQSSTASVTAKPRAPFFPTNFSAAFILSLLSNSSGMLALILPMVIHLHLCTVVPKRLNALLRVRVLEYKSTQEGRITNMIQNWIQKRRLIKQLAKAGISSKTIEEILHFYGVNSK